MLILRHFYVSYSRESSKDSEFALKLAKDLRAAGVSIWIDQLDLESGQSIEEVLAQSIALLVVLSPESVKSPQVQREVTFAQERRNWIVAILVRTCQLQGLFDLQQPFDFRTDYALELEALIGSIGESPWAGGGGPEEDLEPPATAGVPPVSTGEELEASLLQSVGTGWAEKERPKSALAGGNGDAALEKVLGALAGQDGQTVLKAISSAVAGDQSDLSDMLSQVDARGC